MNRTANATGNNTLLENGSVQVNSLFPILFQLNNANVIALYKYVMPLVACAVVFCNLFTIAIFWKIKLMNPTHLLLLSICVCDMLGSLSLGAISVYVLYFEDYRDYLPYRICEMYTFLFNLLPVFFHYTSTYLIVGLSIQRFICVVHPFKAKQMCSKRNTLIFILFAALCSAAYLAFQIHSHTYHVKPTSSYYIANLRVPACSIVVSNFTLWYIHPVLFILLPLAILICIQPAILKTLHTSRLLKATSTSSTHNASRTLSLITVWVVLTFVLCEMPILFYVCATFACLEFGSCSFVSTSSWMVYTHYTLFALTTGQLFNFIIYITFNRRFRDAFGDTLTGCQRVRDKRFTAESFLRETEVQSLRLSRRTSNR